MRNSLCCLSTGSRQTHHNPRPSKEWGEQRCTTKLSCLGEEPRNHSQKHHTDHENNCSSFNSRGVVRILVRPLCVFIRIRAVCYSDLLFMWVYLSRLSLWISCSEQRPLKGASGSAYEAFFFLLSRPSSSVKHHTTLMELLPHSKQAYILGGPPTLQ